MNLPAAIYILRWLVRDTFLQARASGLLGLLVGISFIFILVCLSVGIRGGEPLQREGERADFLPRQHSQGDTGKLAVHGVDVVSGELTLGFGAFKVDLGRDAVDAVQFLQLLLAGGIADTVGVLLALVWTAGFLPTFLDPGTATVMLAKPVPRWGLLLGKYLAVITFLGCIAMLFIGGTWLALAIRTGVWNWNYWLCLPILLIHFAVFYSFSCLVAVGTRSTVAAIIGSICFWLLCWGMNYGRHALVAHQDWQGLSAFLSEAVEVGYWILPKPADLSLLLADALQANNYFSQGWEFQVVKTQGALAPDLSVISSLLFALAMLAVAARESSTLEY